MSRSEDRVYIGPGPVCDKCGTVSRRYKHGPNFRPPTDKGYYREWNICANLRCSKTMFVDGDTYVPAPHEFQPDYGPGCQVCGTMAKHAIARMPIPMDSKRS